MKLAIWRWIWTRAVNGGWPPPVIEWAERRFFDAGMRRTLRRVRSREESEAQRRSFAFGQVAMHDPSVTREMVDAVADTIPAPAEPWACLAGDGPAAEVDDDAAMLADLHGEDFWPTSAQRKGWEG